MSFHKLLFSSSDYLTQPVQPLSCSIHHIITASVVRKGLVPLENQVTSGRMYLPTCSPPLPPGVSPFGIQSNSSHCNKYLETCLVSLRLRLDPLVLAKITTQ